MSRAGICLVLLSAFVFGCGNDEFRLERIDGNQTRSVPFQLTGVSGMRNGASVTSQVRFGQGQDRGQMSLNIHLGPPPECVSGTYQVTMNGQVLGGAVDCESLRYLGGQASTPSVGGTFLFKDGEGKPLFRLRMPPTEMQRRVVSP